VTLLEVRDLRVSFTTADGVVEAVRGISFDVERGATLGIVGESGSGKSVATQSIMGLVRGAQVTGTATLDGVDLITAAPHVRRAMLGQRVGMVFQDPLSSLHPAYRVGWQIVEMIRSHDSSVSKASARERAVELLALVGIPNPRQRARDYPHQFSGGMRQRAMLAMAMALNPELLIADEPTTALDVTVQAQVLEVVRKLQQEFGTAVILITHDLGVVADIADRVVMMYAGTAMEQATRREIFYDYHNPYTEGLLASLPRGLGKRQRLLPIAGNPPSLIDPPPGCPFVPRCPYAFDRCQAERPPLLPVPGGRGHTSACWLPVDEISRARRRQRVEAAEAGNGQLAAPARTGGAAR
jgi:oligopeptide/dipeptide ABC transporter ATP-binding protein